MFSKICDKTKETFLVAQVSGRKYLLITKKRAVPIRGTTLLIKPIY